jgi:hypothetical protein
MDEDEESRHVMNFFAAEWRSQDMAVGEKIWETSVGKSEG